MTLVTNCDLRNWINGGDVYRYEQDWGRGRFWVLFVVIERFGTC